MELIRDDFGRGYESVEIIQGGFVDGQNRKMSVVKDDNGNLFMINDDKIVDPIKKREILKLLAQEKRLEILKKAILKKRGELFK